MNKITIILASLFFICFYIFNQNDYKNTEVIITIPDLTNEDLFYLNSEFNKHSEIEYIGGSIESNTVVLKVDENNFNQKKIEKMLKKWDCEAVHFDYNNLFDVAIIE